MTANSLKTPHRARPIRHFAQALLVAAALPALAQSTATPAASAAAAPMDASSAAAPSPACRPVELAYVGSETGHLLALRLDGCAGRLTLVGNAADVARPRWAVAAAGKLYVASDPAGQDGRIVAYRIDRASGVLEKFDEAPAGGVGTTHLWLDVPSNTLLAAHFGSGAVTSIPLDADGRLNAPSATAQDLGSGPTRRQQGPHAHGIFVDPSGNFALVPDFGADRVFVYPFDRTARALVPLAVLTAQDAKPAGQSSQGANGGRGGHHGGHGGGGMGGPGGGQGGGGPGGGGQGGRGGAGNAPDKPEPLREFIPDPGSGPHHLVFGADGHYVYLLDELSADVTTLHWDEVQGRIAFVQSLPISSPEFQGTRSGAEIARSSDGRFVYVANRGENLLQVYGIDKVSGELALIQRIASGGETPWTFAIDPTGHWLLVANGRSNRLNLMRIDPATGLLEDAGQAVDVPSPLSIVFVKH